MDVTLTELLIAFVVVALSCAVQSGAGFGANLLAAPILLVLNPVFVPGPLIVVGLALTLAMWWRESERGDNQDFWLIIGGRVPGTLLGIQILSASDNTVLLALGIMILGAVLLSAAGLKFRRTPAVTFSAGVASGFMGTAASIGGPAVALLYQDDDGPMLRGRLARILSVGAALSLIGVVSSGNFGSDELALSAALLPPTLIGFYLGPWVSVHLDKGYTRSAVLGLAGVAAVGAIIKALW